MTLTGSIAMSIYILNAMEQKDTSPEHIIHVA